MFGILPTFDHSKRMTMQRIEKTIFISYRRTNAPWALAVFQNLRTNGYDVFFDLTGIASGDFETVIVENIRARAHFVVLLTPSALERCAEPGDWLRREIEVALEARRNIVPLMFEGFDFETPSIARHLTGKLEQLRSYNAVRVPADYFDEAMERVRQRYLNVPLDAVVHPVAGVAKQVAEQAKIAAAQAPAVQVAELTAQQWFEQGMKVDDPGEKLRCYSEAIRLQPDYVAAFNNRGLIRADKADLDGALRDFDQAIRLKPDFAEVFWNRGLARYKKGNLDGAICDYNEGIRFKTNDAEAFFARGNVWHKKGDLDRALRDYDEGIRLKPDFAEAFYNRGLIRFNKGDLDGALRDNDQAIRLKPDFTEAVTQRDLLLRARATSSPNQTKRPWWRKW